jgi:hypothetical protein
MVAVMVGVLGAGVAGYGLGVSRRDAAPAAADARPVVTEMPPWVSEPDCSRLGVRLTVEGRDAFAPAVGERDRAGHKYRRGGERSTWLHVMSGGPITVHGSGDFMSTDTGHSEHPWLSIQVKGEEGSWELARDGRAVMDVTRSDAELIAGRFEADMSKVTDTRHPAFGTPVTRVRGTFCLASVPANPSDTAP